MPGYLIFMRTWKGFADGFPFARLDDVDDATIHEHLEAFCCEQLRPKDKDGKRSRGEVWTRIRDRRRAKKAAAARLRSQRTHPPNSPNDPLRKLKDAGFVVVEEVQEPYLFTAQDPVSGNEQKLCGFKRTPLRRPRILDDELGTYMEMGLSWEQAAEVRFMEYLGPEGRMAHAKLIAMGNDNHRLREQSLKGELCILDSLTGTQRRWKQVDRLTGETRYTLRRKDPKSPSLGCRIAYAAGWLTEQLTSFGGLSPSPQLFVGETDTPVQADDLTQLLEMYNGPEYEDLPLYRARFTVIPASEIPVVDQTNQRLYLESLLSRDPACLVEAVQKRVATTLRGIVQTLQVAQPAPSVSPLVDSARAHTQSHEGRNLAQPREIVVDRSSRHGFSARTKDMLARRVGMRCSNPDCGRPTSGPQSEPNKAFNIGVAAHITAASPGGPRYVASQSKHERSSIENGIWLCQNCAKLVDSDEARFSVELLQQWKKDAEDAAAAGLSRRRTLGVRRKARSVRRKTESK